MSFYLFRQPDNWLEWLWYALSAEKLCVDSGMSYVEAKTYLKHQDIEDVVRFVDTYIKYPKIERSKDNFQYSPGGGNEGCRKRSYKFVD